MLIVSRRKLDTFNRPLCLTIDSNSIKQVSFTSSLSVYTDKNLPWNILISKHLKKIKPLALASPGEVGPLSHLKRSYASIML